VEVGQCRFSGAPRVVVTAGSDPQPADGTAAADGAATAAATADGAAAVVRTGRGISATRATAERAQQSVLDALRRQLSPPGQPEVAWDVDVSLSHRAVASLPDRWRDVTIESLPRSPEGTVQCQAVFAVEKDVVRIPVEARVHRLRQVVVPVRKLEKGQLVGSDDVEVRLVRQRAESDRVVQRVEDAVGRQARQAVLPGLVLDDSLLQNPLLVKRRDVVDVVARRGGVTVRRPMTAMEDGSQGDMITVESLDGLKTRLIARVVGPLSAEVFVSSSAIGPRTENRVATDR